MRRATLMGTVALLVAGCGGKECFDIGCQNGVVVRAAHLPARGATARVCLEGRCVRQPIPARGSIVTSFPNEDDVDQAEATLVVRGPSGRVLTSASGFADLRAKEINGEGCGTCRADSLYYDRRSNP